MVTLIIAGVGVVFAGLTLSAWWCATADPQELREMGIQLERGPATAAQPNRSKRYRQRTRLSTHVYAHATRARLHLVHPVHPVEHEPRVSKADVY